MAKKQVKKSEGYYYKMCNNKGVISVQVWDKGSKCVFGRSTYVLSLGTADNLILKLKRLEELEALNTEALYFIQLSIKMMKKYGIFK